MKIDEFVRGEFPDQEQRDEQQRVKCRASPALKRGKTVEPAVLFVQLFREKEHDHHDADEQRTTGTPIGTFTPWTDIDPDTDLLLYEGLHGAIKIDTVDVARHADLRIGVVPVINLEWIQKLHRDRSLRGYSTEAVMDTVLRRMHDYTHYICPQFSRTHVNLQRVPTVDTSNPFTARAIPSADESFVVIRFRDPKGIDFRYLLSMLHDSFMSRQNTIVVPGGKMELAIEIIFTPFIWRILERKQKAVARQMHLEAVA